MLMIVSNSVTTLLDHFYVVALMDMSYPLKEGLVQVNLSVHM